MIEIGIFILSFLAFSGGIIEEIDNVHHTWKGGKFNRPFKTLFGLILENTLFGLVGWVGFNGFLYLISWIFGRDPAGSKFLFFVAVGTFCAGLAAPIYCLPSFIAVFKQKKNTAAIKTLNALAGWTFFGYVAALVWAKTED